MFENHYQKKQLKTKLKYRSITFRMLFFIQILACSSLSFSEPIKKDEVVTPSAIIDVVYLRPFTLNEGFLYYWRQEQPFIRSGTLAVFKVNPHLVRPRNTAEPVLYAGNQTVQRLNQGHESGFVISIIPGSINLSREPVWFGSPELPERVNAQIIDAEREKAENAEIRPFDAEKIMGVTQEHLEAANLATLLRDHISELVVKYSPQEKALAEAWRLPVAHHTR